MKRLLIIVIVLALIIGAGYLSDALAQPIAPRGALYFWQLFDTPNVYTAQGGKGVRVNSNSPPDGLEFYTISAGGTDEKVGIDAAATTGYIGAASNDGVLRTSSPLTYTDGGDYITLGWSLTSQVQGDIAYFDGSNWIRLAKGTAGQVLEMNAGATAPEWDTDDTGGDPILVNTTAINDASGVDLTDGTGITITLNAGVSPDTATFAFDPTEILGNQTWGDGSTDTIVWTWNRATGTDPTITFNSGSIGLQALTLTTDLAVADGGTGQSNLTNLITLTTHTTGNYADGNAEAGSALTGDAAVDFFGAGVDAVTDTTTCTDIEGTGLSITTGTLNWSAASTDLTDTADILYETELDSFSELQSQISDKTLVNTADGATWLGTHSFSGATVTMPKRTSNDDRFYAFNAWNPNSLYDTDTQLCIEPNLPADITITEVTITLDADPTTELDWDLKWADAFIGLANATLIVAIDTTNGTTDVDSGFNDATVPAGKCIYIEFAADPDSNIKQAIVKIRFDFD